MYVSLPESRVQSSHVEVELHVHLGPGLSFNGFKKVMLKIKMKEHSGKVDSVNVERDIFTTGSLGYKLSSFPYLLTKY
jgi:hypothetical protein